MANRILGCMSLTLSLMGLAGCQSLDFTLPGRAGVHSATSENPVTELICLWEPGEGIGLDGQPARGFAGQVLFFTPNEPEPVRVDGDVRIYVFDNHGTREEQSKPIHQFDFPAEVWNTYLRETNLGATYQIFIPYTRKGGYSAECVLRVRITPENGYPIYSKMSTIHLAGREAPPEVADSPESSRSSTVMTASAQVPEAGDMMMPIDFNDISSRQPALISLQRGTPANTSGLRAAIAEVLRQSESGDEFEEEEESVPARRYSLSGGDR